MTAPAPSFILEPSLSTSKENIFKDDLKRVFRKPERESFQFLKDQKSDQERGLLGIKKDFYESQY